MRARAILALAMGALSLTGPAARAAEPPEPPLTLESWVEEVKPDSARLRARIDPGGLPSTYRLEYVSQSAFERSGYATATVVPPSGKAPLGAGTQPVAVAQQLGPPLTTLTAASTYRYRVIATNSEGTTAPLEHLFTTQPSELHFGLPDGRAWEMVSPPDKGGGAIAAPGAINGGGDFQAAPGSGPEAAAVTYGSATAFGEAAGAPPESQYLSTRTAGGWVTENVSAPLSSVAYGSAPDGAPYRLFAEDLSSSVLFGGLPCRGGLAGCPLPTPVLPGSGAPAGYMAYYLRDSAGTFTSLLDSADIAHASVDPESFSVRFLAATPDLSHIVLSSCAKLTVDAREAPGCGAQNLYEWSGGVLKALNFLPSESEALPWLTSPGTVLAAPVGAISNDGSRVYMYQVEDGPIYLREGTESREIAGTIGEPASFQLASGNGRYAFYTKAGNLYRWDAESEVSTDLTPSGGVIGVLGASEDGSTVYYQDADGIERWKEGATVEVAAGAQAAREGDYPPSTGTSRVSPDGSHLAFLSNLELTGYDNGGRTEAYIYGPIDGGSPQLVCASCNPSGERANGTASLPGAVANGSTLAYRPRALSADGQRLFFDSSDELAVGDTDNEPDVYQWEAKGEGSCDASPGCVSLISSGRALEGASFVDASEDGSDVYFLTGESLVGADPGSADIYDARIGGGFPEAPAPIPCVADACQALPSLPEDPTPGTQVPNSGNPPLKIVKEKRKKKKHGHGKKHAGHKKKSHHRGGKR